MRSGDVQFSVLLVGICNQKLAVVVVACIGGGGCDLQSDGAVVDVVVVVVDVVGGARLFRLPPAARARPERRNTWTSCCEY